MKNNKMIGLLSVSFMLMFIVGCVQQEPTPQVGQCWKDTYGEHCRIQIVRFRDSDSGVNDLADYRLLDSDCDAPGKSSGRTEWSYPVDAWKRRFNPVSC